MKQPFIDYFIQRRNSLPDMGGEIDFIIASKRGIRRARLGSGLGLFKILTGIMGYPVMMKASRELLFLVKRKDTGKMEAWFEDYLIKSDPDWDLMAFMMGLRAHRGRISI